MIIRVSGTFAILVAATPYEGRTITKVEFFIRGVLAHTDTASPFAYSWLTSGDADGECDIEARATDSDGEVGSGYRNCIIQNGTSGPYVDILSPDDEAIVSGIVTIDVYASDIVGVVNVKIYLGGVLKKTDTSAPYGYSWDSTSVANGEIELEVVAEDTDTNTTTVTYTLFVQN